jgi:hypothetical protein
VPSCKPKNSFIELEILAWSLFLLPLPTYASRLQPTQRISTAVALLLVVGFIIFVLCRDWLLVILGYCDRVLERLWQGRDWLLSLLWHSQISDHGSSHNTELEMS